MALLIQSKINLIEPKSYKNNKKLIGSQSRDSLIQVSCIAVALNWGSSCVVCVANTVFQLQSMGITPSTLYLGAFLFSSIQLSPGVLHLTAFHPIKQSFYACQDSEVD